ncbi:endosome-associated-trafficking regulator 1 [Sardina pilchardus]|uniref:endosome-associated-trafficking regulator 1 n=1 Tax=Sardina pilchardus TaxID=27697 RepID=UPI002E10C551
MSKGKRLADSDDDLQEREDELNPFSFKEFIRSKEQHGNNPLASDGKGHVTKEKTYVRADQPERDCSLPAKGFDEDQKGLYFSDSISQEHTDIDEPEEEWAGSYQPLAFEEAHNLGLCGTIDRIALSDGYPFTSFGNYETEKETFITDVPYQTCESNAEYGNGRHPKLKEENAQLKKHIKELLKKSEVDDQRIRHLTEELQNKKVQDECEAKALETMVQSVEQNLQLMTKRAVKAENTVTKLKQEIHQLQDQLEVYRGEVAVMNAMKRNAHTASEYLSKATRDAETSIKQLLTGAETLHLVSQMLNSIDKITENIPET